MKKISILFFSIVATCSVMGQSVKLELIGVGSGHAKCEELVLEWSVGESFIQYHETDSGLLTEGFIQPELFWVDLNDSETFPETISEPFLFMDDFYLEAFPNPVYDQLTLRLEQPFEAPSYISVLDVTGKLIYSATFPAGDQQKELDMTNLPEGLYLVRFISPQMKISNSIKIIKAK